MVPDRPLRLGEVFAETIHLYGRRRSAAVGLGLIEAGAFLVSRVVPGLFSVLVLALAFTALYAAAARLVAGDSFTAAWQHVGGRVPVLVVLTFVVAVPFAIAVGYLFLLVLAVLWLALSGFSIPVAMIEERADVEGSLDRLAYSLHRSVLLARAEYLHAAGVVAALVIVYLVLGTLIGVSLIGFADNGGVAAAALVQLVLGALLLPRPRRPLLRAAGTGRCILARRRPRVGGEMPKYLMLSTLSDQGLQTLRANPDRLREVNKDVEELGAKVLHQWFVLGPHDFVNIVEAESSSVIAEVSIALGARGSVHTQSYEMLEVDDLMKLLGA